ncbi:hypothetical protein [Lacticaseibacillus daqingensis]|nr:hypothetical protein [Lacticaseibacillus daqingensis]
MRNLHKGVERADETTIIAVDGTRVIQLSVHDLATAEEAAD